MTAHTRTSRSELGYTRNICAECGTDWPCIGEAMRRCEEHYLAEGLSCDCGHHSPSPSPD